jgi:hypothetical protein
VHVRIDTDTCPHTHLACMSGTSSTRMCGLSMNDWSCVWRCSGLSYACGVCGGEVQWLSRGVLARMEVRVRYG